MLCAFPFCSTDVDRLLDMLEWCVQLGHQNHPSLLIADPNVPWDKAIKALDLAKKAFNSAEIVSLDHHVEGWITGSCALFKKTAIEAKARNTNFLFMEPDAVPLKPTWMDELESSYARSGKPFMGALISHQTKGLPSPYLEGIAVYPANAIDVMEPVWRNNQSWTLACAEAVVPLSTNTPLIKHVWGEKNKPPPVFAETNVPSTHIFCLRNIPPEAVIWHRCKDGSLIRHLRQRLGLTLPARELMVVLPFCPKDIFTMLKNLRWMMKLGGLQKYHCLLSYDRGVPSSALGSVRDISKHLFTSVQEYSYEKSARGLVMQTIAFMQAAKRVHQMWRGPWLWMESDMIPLKAGWLNTLCDEYYGARKLFMGSVVPGMEHMNGTGFYPYDAPARIPKALSNIRGAWDMSMKSEMMQDCHNASHLMQHVWVVDRNGRFQPHGSGTPPSFRDRTFMSQIFPTAVTFHRCKDGSLIDRLTETHK